MKGKTKTIQLFHSSDLSLGCNRFLSFCTMPLSSNFTYCALPVKTPRYYFPIKQTFLCVMVWLLFCGPR